MLSLRGNMLHFSDTLHNARTPAFLFSFFILGVRPRPYDHHCIMTGSQAGQWISPPRKPAGVATLTIPHGLHLFTDFYSHHCLRNRFIPSNAYFVLNFTTYGRKTVYMYCLNTWLESMESQGNLVLGDETGTMGERRKAKTKAHTKH